MKRNEEGFTIIEMLVAVAIMMAVTGAVFSLVNPAHGVFQTQPEVADVQQRLRVSVDTLTRDLSMAGAGISTGTAAGPLVSYFAPVMPYRRGEVGDDGRTGTFYRPDAISILYVPSTSAQTTAIGAIDLGSELVIAARVNCGLSVHDRLCGFTEDMRVLLFDPRGAFDTATVTDVQGQSLRVRHGPLSSGYDRGDTIVAEVASHTYYLKADTSTNTFQLMHYDGYQTDRPVVDNVVKMAFEYFGAPEPPRMMPDVSTSATEVRATTYGPLPPPLDADEPSDSWPAGENCVFAVASGSHVSRLPTVAPGTTPVRLDPAMLRDGPWCPDATHAMRFDADLFRVRRVRVVVRVQAAAASMRGPTGVLFTRGGTRSSAERFVPDQEIRMDVTPRNMGAGRGAQGD